jgi:hypothetical protein
MIRAFGILLYIERQKKKPIDIPINELSYFISVVFII